MAISVSFAGSLRRHHRATIASVAFSVGLVFSAHAQEKPLPDGTSSLTDEATAPDDTQQDNADFETNKISRDETDNVSDVLDGPDPSPDTLNRVTFGRQNTRIGSVDALRTTPVSTEQTPGIPIGTFTLRPALTGGAGYEHTKTGKSSTSRSYLETGLKGTLTSDWSSHQLRIDAAGSWQKTLSGVKEDDPEASVDAALRLDISKELTANLRLGYSLEREDVSSANAVSSAEEQGEVASLRAGADITREIGRIRGMVGVDFERSTYGSARLANGTTLDQSDRDRNKATLRGRIGYEISPALIPFIEASFGRILYDEHRDSSGYVRDAALYTLKSGVQADFGEKLRGEISGGYALADFEDSRLEAIKAVTFDANMLWSPLRGSDVAFGLRTDIEPSTTAGASGSVAYTTDAALTQVILENLTGKLASAITWRDYSGTTSPHQIVYNTGAGLSWGVSRSIDFNTDISWERSTQKGTANTDTLRAGVGLTLKR